MTHEHRSLKTYAKQEIENLVSKVKKGDKEAFAKIYDIFADPIYRYLYYRVNPHEAEDLLATIFLKVWTNLNKYRFDEASFSSWIFRIAHNTLVDFYRNSRRTEELSDSLADGKKENSSTNEIERKLRNETLKKALGGLKENYRQIILLKFISELSTEEIAQILGKSENSLRILQFRALKALRRALEKMGITQWETE